jgi:hypothetical protein
MSWRTMTLELAGQVPVPEPLAKIFVQRSWVDLQKRPGCLWSFLWGDAAIPTPQPTQTGTVTTVIGDPHVTGDAAASAAWGVIPLSTPITTQQFRVGQGTIYNIVSIDNTNPAARILTLDRMYVDPTAGAGVGYQILGVYYNAPAKDFLWWETIVDPISGYSIGTVKTREEVDSLDPQRFQSGWPQEVIPYLMNPNKGNFYQYPMYEVWPAPLNGYTYAGKYFRRGMPFQALSDEVRAPLGEDVVMEQAKMLAYEWCIVNPDKVPKADYRYAHGKAEKRFSALVDDYLVLDEEFSHRHIIPSGQLLSRPDLPWTSQRELVTYSP